MNSFILTEFETKPTWEALKQQLERICSNHRFSHSTILKKFLSYIVLEVFNGRGEFLKEYTIAVNVLLKPSGFKTYENGIVRIHAGRLRRALDQYYGDEGTDDRIIIKIPTGKYVPVFIDRYNDPLHLTQTSGKEEIETENTIDSICLGILPLICSEQLAEVKSFADDLCLQISASLSRVNQISVIAYQALRNTAPEAQDYKNLGQSFGINYLITGSAQRVKNSLRLNIQFIECNTYRQLWSESYSNDLSNKDLFEIQDEICNNIIQMVREFKATRTYACRNAPFTMYAANAS